MLEKVLWIPFCVQIFAMMFDEFYFHWKRGLPKWERIGHPLDTLSIVAAIGYIVVVPYSRSALLPYILLAILSCLLVTKDEWVHRKHCNGKEQWLHALLFLNHPLVLLAMGFLWQRQGSARSFLLIQFVMTILFCLYQIVYWNFIWKEKQPNNAE